MARPSSAAERQRQYRERRDADPQRRAEYLEREREKWRKDKETGKKKGIIDLSEREKRAKRKKWRESKQAYRARIKACDVAQFPAPTPSPEHQPVTGHSRQHHQGKHMRKKTYKKLHRDIEVLRSKLESEKRKKEKYRKRLARLREKTPSVSPCSKVKELLRHHTVKSPVKKALLFHTALIETIKEKYRSARKQKDKHIVANLTSGNILKKYKIMKYAQTVLGFSRKRRTNLDGGPCSIATRVESRTEKEVKRKVKAFFLRDDVSRMTTGRKQTITRLKTKMQKRFLTDTMKNLHRKFISEEKDLLSYSSFCRLRPFWVVTPRDSDRETCQCRTHENLQYMANTLHKLGILCTKNIEAMADSTMCDPKSKICAYADCQECFLTTYPKLKPPENSVVLLTQWTSEKLQREEGKLSTITVKREIQITEAELASQFEERLAKFRKHVFNIRWQYTAYRELRESLKRNECLLHVDFSENYTCKYSQEIQSVHFGGSHQQATLHTGVLYTAVDQSPITFCSISPSRRHDPNAIWAHLSPILQMVRQKYPDVSRLHFFSDGPAAQYKQKGNFYLLSTEPFKHGYQEVTWNFFEASHGKGAPDGVGGALKRSADRAVQLGKDIPDAQTLYHVLKGLNSSVELFFINENEVEARPEIPALDAIKGTMKIHQVICVSPNQIKCRDLSCVCKKDVGILDCSCFELKAVTLGCPVVSNSILPSHTNAGIPWRPDSIEQKHIGEWCVVNYDNEAYPGIIMDVEENNIQVKCMHCNGINKFYWQSLREDICWYSDAQIICLIPEPQPLNKRSVQMEKSAWMYVQEQLS